jgi:RNA polymerase sigma-70 factor (ECF subfamily)
MLNEAAVPATTEDAVRRMLHARVDEAYRLATFILRDPAAAEDAVQEAALLAWRKRRSLRDDRAVDGWFTRILVNVCRDELRHRSRQPRVVTLDPAMVGGESDAARDRVDLGPAIRRLTPDEQALLALRFGRELTVPDIAERLGLPDGTVKSRLHAALQHLRAAIDAERRAEEAAR